MVTNAFANSTIIDVFHQKNGITSHSFIKDIIKKRDLTDFGRLLDFFQQELQQASLQDKEAVDSFLFLVRESLLFSFFRKDQESFQSLSDIFRHRLTALKTVTSPEEVNPEAWENFVGLMEAAISRIVRHVAIEDFESKISGLEWGSFPNSFIGDLSSIIGFVYLNEEDQEQKAKARIWLMKAMGELPLPNGLFVHLLMARYYLESDTPESETHLNQIIQKLKDTAGGETNAEVRTIIESCTFELEGAFLVWKFRQPDDSMTRMEHSQLQLKEYETRYAQNEELTSFAKTFIESLIGSLYHGLYQMTDDSLEKASFSKQGQKHLDQAIELSDQSNDQLGNMNYRLLKAEIAIATEASLTEKDIKEVLQYYKKRQNYPDYVKSVQSYARLLANNGAERKTYDLVLDVIKFGQKKFEQGGFYLITSAFRLSNEIFQAETNRPGVSWMVEILDSFFEKITQATQDLENHMELIGKSLIEEFRRTYIEFEPVSHFNIKTYLRYQQNEIRMMRIGSLMNDDALSEKIADNLLKELHDENNPLNFIEANWEEFKLVPNAVRNNTLNKCINISKGDLPLAAEHLDFSYRNLRSYITFKEVNRLGFFLDMQQTSNRQLEQGIRYMFYDLYKRGTIFEVVFDMPRFLVKYAKTGFFSQDLERELNIKGTTAKKYIKIMMEINLIRQDKSTGRKHYYRLIRENVMNRLGADQNTLIES